MSPPLLCCGRQLSIITTTTTQPTYPILFIASLLLQLLGTDNKQSADYASQIYETYSNTIAQWRL